MSSDTDAETPSLSNLPEDIIYVLIHYLPLADFLALCKTSRIFYGNLDIRLSASYWSRLTRATFRVPNYPVVSKDGARWMALYRRLLLETKVYAWGNNDKGCLGGELQMIGPPGGRLSFGMRTKLQPSHRAWPDELRLGRGHAISDLQCGGWSINALTSKGALFTIGILDGLDLRDRRLDSPVPHRLEYPPGFTPPTDRYDAFTAIQQFSAGRQHVLGLSDSGRIWSWDDANNPAVHVKFLNIDLEEGESLRSSSSQGRVTKVIAGWSRSSAYVIGKGIITWEPSNTSELQGGSDQSGVDTMLVLEPWLVPLTSYREPRAHHSHANSKKLLDDTDARAREVVSWCVLTQFIVFSTTTGHVFISKIPQEGLTNLLSICITGHLDFSDPSQSDEFVLDVQGAHQRFAVFKRNGAVLISTEDFLHDVWDRGSHDPTRREFSKYPCLQDSGVISLAFGDHHWHALHADGTISSYGAEKSHRGGLGLGGDSIGVIRGLVTGDSLDNFLPNDCYATGRRVSFEPEKRDWLLWVHIGGAESKEDVDARKAGLAKISARVEVSEWFESKLSNWETPSTERQDSRPTFGEADDPVDDGLPSYFALSVAAGGWHSGALVLVNQAKAEKVRRKYHASQMYTSSGELMASPPKWIWEQRQEKFPQFKLIDGESLCRLRDMDGREVVETPLWLKENGWKAVEHVSL